MHLGPKCPLLHKFFLVQKRTFRTPLGLFKKYIFFKILFFFKILTQLIWVLNVLLRIVICYLFNQDIWDTSKEGPKCPGPNCPGPKCPGPNCPGAQLSVYRIPVGMGQVEPSFLAKHSLFERRFNDKIYVAWP